MIIHLDGTAEELLEFVKGMQFPIAAGFADLEDDRAETEREVAEEIEKSFGAKEMPMGGPEEDNGWYEVSFDMPREMVEDLAMKAMERGTSLQKVIIDMIKTDMRREGKGK